MIIGIGNDIIAIARIKRLLSLYPQKFLDRLFTVQEQSYCLQHVEPSLRFAGRFAAKEAIAKALGTGFRNGLAWLDLEILPDSQGKPVLHLSSFAKTLFPPHTVMHLSISHCHEYAAAMAIWEDLENSKFISSHRP